MDISSISIGGKSLIKSVVNVPLFSCSLFLWGVIVRAGHVIWSAPASRQSLAKSWKPRWLKTWSCWADGGWAIWYRVSMADLLQPSVADVGSDRHKNSCWLHWDVWSAAHVQVCCHHCAAKSCCSMMNGCLMGRWFFPLLNLSWLLALWSSEGPGCLPFPKRTH